MNAPVIEIKRFAVHDGDGIRTTLFLKGCPLRCLWCHNPEGLKKAPEIAYYADKCISCGECMLVCPAQAHTFEEGSHRFLRDHCTGCGKCESACLGEAIRFYGRSMSPDAVLPLLLEDRDFYESSGGGVTLSGGECLLHPEFCEELLRLLKAHGIRTAVDTCGFVPRSALDRVLPFADVFLYDVKAIDEATHIRCTGQSNRLILENLRYLDEKGAPIEVRIPFVPGLNSGEIDAIGSLLVTLKSLRKVRVLPYHNYAGSKYRALGIDHALPDRLPTDTECTAAREHLRAMGLRVVE